MLKTAFSFDLPEELIAQRPCGRRGGDRLMVLRRAEEAIGGKEEIDRAETATEDTPSAPTAGTAILPNDAMQHKMIDDLPSLIAPGTIMVFNNSRVRRARVKAVKESTGREHEFMFIRREGEADVYRTKSEEVNEAARDAAIKTAARQLGDIPCDGSVWRVLTGNARKQKPSMRYLFPGGIIGTVLDNKSLLGTEERDIAFSRQANGETESYPITEDYFDKYGHIPLPPYIKREDDASDADRYQNVYATTTGSAACPTAGLHFTDDMLRRLGEAGAEIVYVTLHVGLGTFLPVREEHIEDHKMHQETYTISDDVAAAINMARREGRPVLAVGTTSVRTLESAAKENGIIVPGSRSTSIFIYPGYRFKAVDEIITNFHTPQSTLLMLVSAFAGRERILAAYKEAVREKYRFFSYGDAMLIR